MGSITANQSPRDNAVVFSLKRGNSKTLRLSANDSPTWAAAVPGGCWAPSTLNPDDKLPAPTGIPMSPWIPGGLNCDPHGVCPNPKTFFTLAVGGFPKTEVVWGNPGGVEILGCCIPSSCLLPPWGVPYEPLPPADALRLAISCWIWFSTFFNAWACRASSSKRSRWVNPSGNTTEARAPAPGPAPCWCGNPPARWAASEGWAVSDGWAGWPAPFWPVWTPPSTSRLTFSLQNTLVSGGRGGVIKPSGPSTRCTPGSCRARSERWRCPPSGWRATGWPWGGRSRGRRTRSAGGRAKGPNRLPPHPPVLWSSRSPPPSPCTPGRQSSWPPPGARTVPAPSWCPASTGTSPSCSGGGKNSGRLTPSAICRACPARRASAALARTPCCSSDRPSINLRFPSSIATVPSAGTTAPVSWVSPPVGWPSPRAGGASALAEILTDLTAVSPLPSSWINRSNLSSDVSSSIARNSSASLALEDDLRRRSMAELSLGS